MVEKTMHAPQGPVRLVVLDGRDNVGNALVDLPAAEEITVVAPGGKESHLILRDAIPLGHKMALRAISVGEAIVKYGLPIGTATKDIAPGQHVHVHNVR
jgi:hypothetical protein